MYGSGDDRSQYGISSGAGDSNSADLSTGNLVVS